MEESEEYLFKFECTGRTFPANRANGLSIDEKGNVRYGYDGYVFLMDDEGNEDGELEFTSEEKKELALFMIDKWKRFRNI